MAKRVKFNYHLQVAIYIYYWYLIVYIRGSYLFTTGVYFSYI